MSVQGFVDIIQGPLAQYLASSKQIGDVVATHSDIVNKAFQAQLDYVTLASQSSQPNQTQQIALLQPTSAQITSIQEFREKNRSSKFFNHLSAISESIPALGWVTVVSINPNNRDPPHIIMLPLLESCTSTLRTRIKQHRAILHE